MKRTVFLLAIVALLVACQESLEDRCAREAKEYTEKKCPTLVIKDVTLDSLRFERIFSEITQKLYNYATV